MPSFANILVPPLAAPLTYSVPANIDQQVQVGSRVTIPLGKRFTLGFVVSKFSGAPENSQFKIKDIFSEKPVHTCFNQTQLKFFQWIANYYGDSLTNVIDVAIPHFVTPKTDKLISLIPNTAATNLGRLQSKIIAVLKEENSPVSYTELSQKIKGLSSAIKSLEKKNLIQVQTIEAEEQYLDQATAPEWAKTSVDLNEHQSQALEEISTAIEKRNYQPFCLHGVTGSGKTEVYIEAICQALKVGLSSIVIVPEIALTPQLIDRFKARLGNNLAILHSGLNRRFRWESWRALLEGRTKVVIGARSGIFAPTHNLGLIIVDEEHESSYKQSEGLRYNARDLALVRAKLENCSVILGSATPSLETYHHATSQHYKMLTLPARHSTGSNLAISVVDLNKVPPWEMVSKNISPQLAKAISETLIKKQQVFLLYNRRGFASYLQCEKCEAVIECPNCNVTMTYHRSKNQLLCHYCNLNMIPKIYCPSCACQSKDKEPPKLEQRGAGTEKVFDELAQLFPEAAIARLDRDSVADEAAYREILQRVRNGDTQILVGTQMIAKGHDLPGVTLVGVIDCDVGLHMPDFRAGERVFQLLTQAAGRAGRGSQAGNVILQTRAPKSRSIHFTKEKDFLAFAAEELASRKKLNYPPFTRILRIICSSTDKELAVNTLKQIRISIDQLGRKQQLPITVLGPTPAPLSKLKTLWRWHVLIKAPGPADLNKIIKEFSVLKYKNKKVRLAFDIDPQDMM